MAIIRYSIAPTQIEERVRLRLTGTGTVTTRPQVAWGDGDATLVLHPPSLKVRMRSGWLLCNLDAHVPDVPASTLQLVYFLGRDDEGDALVSAATINAATPADAELAEAWSNPLLRVVWDGVLDVLEGTVNSVVRTHPGQPVELVAFSCSDSAFQIDISVGN